MQLLMKKEVLKSSRILLKKRATEKKIGEAKQVCFYFCLKVGEFDKESVGSDSFISSPPHLKVLGSYVCPLGCQQPMDGALIQHPHPFVSR